MSQQTFVGRASRLAAIALAAACTSPLAIAAATSQPAGASYSESVSVAMPGEHVTGTTSGRDAQGNVPDQDQALLDKVMTALVDNPQLQGAQVHVSVENGRVVLTGKAKDAEQARYVRDAAQAAAGSAPVDSRVDAG
jgi:hypothetical protein